MVICSRLFSSNRGQNADLYSVLEYQKQRLINRITVIASLDEMTDAFLTGLVQGSLIQPLALRRGDITRDSRTELFEAQEFPDRFWFNVQPGNHYPKIVFRISLPFSGDRNLFDHPPSRRDFNPPVGQVSGSEVQFDVVLWGYQDDAKRVGQQITENLDGIERYAGYANEEVRAHNSGLSAIATAAFQQKLERLSGQHAIFDSLGIKEKEKPKPPPAPVYTSAPEKPSKKPRSKDQIIQYVQNIYVESIQRMEVETLNQTNVNDGNVNNSFQTG